MPVDYAALVQARFPEHPPYQWSDHPDAPLVPLAKPLVDCRVTLVSSGGVYIEGQPPFEGERDEYEFRVIPPNTPRENLRFRHRHYDTTDAERDPNCMFPYEPLKAFAREGRIGSVGPRLFGFMGRLFSRRRLLEEMAPRLLGWFREDAVDAALFVPG